MANAKYVELVLKEEGMPKHYLSGYVVVSDHRSDGQRHLFLKREKPEPKPSPKKKAARKPKVAAPPEPEVNQ